MQSSPNKVTKQYNSNPDIRSMAEAESPIKSTQRKRKQPVNETTDMLKEFSDKLYGAITALSTSVNSQLSEISNNVNAITTDLSLLKQTTQDIKEEIQILHSQQSHTQTRVSELEKRQEVIQKTISELEMSANYHADLCSDFQKRLDHIDNRPGISDQTLSTITTLQTKIESLEQQVRHCNIELCNVPEKRNENLYTIIEKLRMYIGHTIPLNDIASIHRVPHAQKDITRPKNIIMKLTSRRVRNNVLSAFRLKKEVTSQNLEIPGTSTKIYIVTF